MAAKDAAFARGGEVNTADNGVIRRFPDAKVRSARGDQRLNSRRFTIGHFGRTKVVAKASKLVDIEQLLRPTGGNQNAARVASNVAHADFVVDVAICDAHIGNDEVGKCEPLDHVLYDHGTGIGIGADRCVPHAVNCGVEGLAPQ